MPKLTERVLEKNQVHIEDAALRVFTRQGFHGTSVREIAAEAGVSLGNLYNYYKTKEDIFVSLLKRFDQRMARIMATRLAPLIGSLDSENLQKLSGVVREIVRDHPDYWRLMYIDVVEFGNQHFAHIFRDLIPILRRLNPQLSQKKVTAGLDPTVAFAAIYLQFFTYYLVETLFGGKQHLGMSDDDAISQLIRLYTTGVGGNGNGKQSPARRRRK